MIHGKECAGVSVERRQLLLMSTAAIAYACGMVGGKHALARDEQDSAELTLESMIQLAHPLAERVVRGRLEDEEEYLSELESLLERVKHIPSAEFPPAQDVATAGLTVNLPLVVVQYKLAPGAVIPYHDHRNYNGALGVIEGAIELRSFEIANGTSSPVGSDDFQIVETGNATMAEGSVSTLSRSRENIHHLRARRQGARLIDVFTFFRSDARSVYLQVDDAHPVGGNRKIYNARWL